MAGRARTTVEKDAYQVLGIDSHVCNDCDCHDLYDFDVDWNRRDVNGRDEVAGRIWG